MDHLRIQVIENGYVLHADHEDDESFEVVSTYFETVEDLSDYLEELLEE